MKRCPECGYRVKVDELRDCPLCGVRMRNDPDGQTIKIETHIHENEDCLLPNASEGDAARERYKSVMERQLRRAGKKQQPAMPKQLKQLIGFAVVLIIYALLGSCSI